MSAEDVIKAYEKIFQDDYGMWLKCVCDEKADPDTCRCLDSVQLNLALLWMAEPLPKNPRFSFDCAFPYLVDIYADTTIKEDESIRWCVKSSDLKLAAPSGNAGRSTINDLNFLREDMRLLFAELCLYAANTREKREKLTEFYLAVCPNIFFTYVGNLFDRLNGISAVTDTISRHINMILGVLRLYDGSDKTRFKEIKNIIYEPLYDYTVSRDGSRSRSNFIALCSVLDNNCYKSLEAVTLPLNYKFIDNIRGIAGIIKNRTDKAEWDKYKITIKKICDSIEKIIDASKRGGEAKIGNAVFSLKNLIK